MNAWPRAAGMVFLVCRVRSQCWRGARRRAAPVRSGCRDARWALLALHLTLSQRSLNAPSTLPQRPSTLLGARTETLAFARSDRNMQKPKFTARVHNIYFLSRIGSSLRWATQGSHPRSCRATSNTCWNGSMSSRPSRTSCRGPTTIAPEPTGGPDPPRTYCRRGWP